ncbi:MAG: UPF0175 family protein [Fimbriimonadaceae bacterium]|nr:UPF0175 family protein [Fimbriimonadaceae bacterium]
MALHLQIPDEVAAAMAVPAPDRADRALLELAVALYAQQLLSFGKARQLSRLSRQEFAAALVQRQIPRHYDDTDLAADLAYARGQ